MREHTHGISRRTFLGGAAAFGAVSLATPSLAFATPTAAEKQAEADSVREQVTSMQQELSQASDNYYLALEEHDRALASMEEAQARIDEATGKITDLQGKLGTRARSMYRSGSSSFLDILLGATTFEEFATNWTILNQLNQSDADMVQDTKTLRAQVEEEKKEYERQEKIAAEKSEEARVIKEQAEATVVEMTAILDSLDEEARQLLEQEQQAAAEAAAAAERAAMEAELAASGGGGGGSSGGGGGSSGGGSSSGGGYTGGTSSIPAKGSVVDYAVSRLGCPYVWGATGPDSFDCSGLTSWCYSQVGIWITRTTYSQIAAAKAVLPVSAAEPGDVLHNSGHVGICTAYGGGTYIHAPQPGDVVKYSSWSQFNCALRF
ncbi:MAG: NlpC/P60 family protein [Raoultibacter sp.]